MDRLLDLLPVAVACGHVFLAPYTKVEESFTLHAFHDVIYLGPTSAFRDEDLQHWDHVAFPGPLPRSFLPALLLGPPVRLLAQLGTSLGCFRTKLDVQILLRLVLAILSSATLVVLARSLGRRYGPTARRIFILLTSTQFHGLFYAGRTLPNFIALPLVNLTLALLLASPSASSASARTSRHIGLALSLLTFTAATIRSELALLLAPLVVTLLVQGRIGILGAIRWGAIGGFSGMGLSMLVDSTLWRHPWLWPEAYTIIFNVIEGKASEWGTSPWNSYILNLPLLLLSALPLLAVTLSRRALRRETAGMTVPAFAMVAGLSKLAHKEWRFIYYAVVWLNAAAAVGGAWIWTTRSKSRARTLAAIVLLPLGLLGNIAVTTSLTLISSRNYPGGELMSILHRVEPASANVHLYSPSYPLQTGSTLFTNLHGPLPPSTFPIHPPSPVDSGVWQYTKTEFPPSTALTPSLAAQEGWTHIILEDKDAAPWVRGGWEKIGEAWGVGGIGSGSSSSEQEWWWSVGLPLVKGGDRRIGVRKAGKAVLMRKPAGGATGVV